MNISTETIVQQIHETPHRAVIAITGGGTGAIGTLLNQGGGSNTLLEAVVPYDQNSVHHFIKGKPDKYCSEDAARDLAMASYLRAESLHKDNFVVGVGVTSSLHKLGERQGRKNIGYIGIQTHDKTAVYSYEFPHLDIRENLLRPAQEHYLSEEIIRKLAIACGLPNYAPIIYLRDSTGDFATVKIQETITQAEPGWVNILTGQGGDKAMLFYNLAGKDKPANVFPGSFNPIHPGHIGMAEHIFNKTGEPVAFEICVHNVDKPALNFHSLKTRLDDLKKNLEGKPFAHSIVFTKLPTFAEKSEFFSNTNFIVGWDTFARISNPKYYGDQAVKIIANNKSRFIVCHRNPDQTQEQETDIPEDLKAISTILPASEFAPSGLSSSDLRKAQK